MKSTRRGGLNSTALALIPLAIAINIAGGQLVKALRLPIYLDSIGTVLAGALLGYRLPAFIALNEPETSLHPDLLEPLARMIIANWWRMRPTAGPTIGTLRLAASASISARTSSRGGRME